MPKLRLSYPEILQQFGPHTVKERTESRALLAWFLENYYRLDEMEVSDCICDGKYDKGIDGIYVNDHLGQIDISQTVIVQTDKGLGDVSLKEFAGSLSQFKNRASVENLVKSSKNPALTSLLKSNEIARKVEEGFTVQGIFVTNAVRDQNAKDFLASHHSITLYDRDELEHSYTPLDKTAPIAKEMSFNIGSVPHMVYQLSAKVQMVIASLSAEDLVSMEGIASGELFAWNVRQFLGRKTKVNKDIAKSIQSSAEHNLFPAFHNGLTILCERLETKPDKITIGGYAVVNGCQSLNSLYENKKDITKELRIITKFINVPPNDPLATKITDHTNNQNGTTFRDLQSNNPIQVRLQSEIHKKYKNDSWFRIKRGEHLEWPADRVIENERVARVLLAFDLRDPASCHQTYKLFDELHADIFGRPEVDADRIVLANDIYNLVVSELDSMANQLFGKYGLTRYVIIYLLREALETDDTGRKLCKNPSQFLNEPNGRRRLTEALGNATASLVRILDGEVTRRNKTDGAFFDYKSDLKSPKAVEALRATIISQYQIVVDNGYAPRFSDAWKASTQSPKKKNEF